MARTAIHVTTLGPNAFTAAAAGTAIDATNGMYIPATAGAPEEYVVWVHHTTGSSKTVTVGAGDNPPADAAGQGTLAAAFADGSSTPVEKYIGPFTSARFIQDDGTINVDFTASATGTIEVYKIPRTA